MNSKDEIDPRLAKHLAALENIQPRDARKAAYGKAAFLRQAAELREGVSSPRQARPIGWIHAIRSKFFLRKEQSPMFGTFATILLVLTLVFGGSSATVAAAQTSLPDEPLYGLKLLSEDVRVQLSAGPEAKLEVQLQLLERRMNEIREMIAQGETPSEEVLLRLQSQVEQTLRLAVGMPENEALRSMSQVQERLRRMDQTVTEDLALLEDETLEPGMSPDMAPGMVMTQVRAMLQERINWIEDANDDPDHLRQMLQDRDRDQTEDPTQDRLRDRDRDQLNICEDCTSEVTPEDTPEGTPQGEYPWGELPPWNLYGYGKQPEEAPVPGPGPQNTDQPGPGPAERPEPAQPGPKSSEDAPKNGKP